MFDKTFFKFAIGFVVIIIVSMSIIYLAKWAGLAQDGLQTATAK